jgi:hypothetical protein
MKLTTSNAQSMSYVRALVHGNSGIGKTTSLLTLPEASTVVVALERGLIPLRKRAYRVIEIECWDDLRELVKAMAGSTLQADGALTFALRDATFADVRVLAVDSLTAINELAKRQIVEVDRRAMTKVRTKGKEETPAGIYDDVLSQEDWGLLATRLGNLTASINRMPLHTVFTALSAKREDKKTGQMTIAPALQGQYATAAPAYFDVVVHMENVIGPDGEDVRVWRTKNDGMILAKDASAALDQFEPADWMQLFKKIIGGKKAQAQEKQNTTETATETQNADTKES